MQKKTSYIRGNKKDSIKNIVPTNNKQHIPRHHFSALQIHACIDIFLNTNAGFRGTSYCIKTLVNYSCFEPFNYCSIRQWVLRLGFGLLNMPVKKADDWIYIVDFSIQLGQERCFLVIGVNFNSLHKDNFCLEHKQMRVLDICVQKHFTGEDVCKRLNMVSSKTGRPAQIISDRGNDVRKGIELFCKTNPETFHTYDISHAIGVILKKHLAKDNRWMELQNDLSLLAQQTKQTDVSFLRPIAVSKKAKWLNIDKIIKWLSDIFSYQQKADYSLIAKGYKIKDISPVMKELKNKCNNKYEEARLKNELNLKVFNSQEEACDILSGKGYKKNIELIDAGKMRFTEKFAVLEKHNEFYKELHQLNDMLCDIKTTIKSEGISCKSIDKITGEKEYGNYPLSKMVYNDIVDFLKAELVKASSNDKPILACSDIIESIFGKFKCKIGQAVGGIYESVLIIALYCTELSTEMITDILTEYKMDDVKKWFSIKLEMSNLAKRRVAFNFT